MYYPDEFERRRAIQLGELIGQAYLQFDAYRKNEPWSLHADCSLIAELKYTTTMLAAPGGMTTTFETEWRQLAKSRPSVGEGLPIGFIARNKSEVFLIFRGTMTTEEWIRDFSMRLTAYPYGMDGGVHEGFVRLYEVFRRSIQEGLGRIESRKKLYIAGHSLGAALATLAAPDIAPKLGSQDTTVYTFASPRVGDRVFANGYNRLFKKKSFRIANTCDMVVALPFPVPFLGFLGGYFTHVETPVDFTAQEEAVEKNHDMEIYMRALRSEPEKRGVGRSIFGWRR
jgi:triacylglycerol lipase